MNRTAIALLCLAGAGLTVQAQGPDQKGTNTVAPYQDRVIEGLITPEAVDREGKEPGYNQDGWARYLRLEGRVGTDLFDAGKTATGMAFYGLIETPNYGVLSADLSAAPNIGRQALTLRQRGLPMDSGWVVNNEAGVIGTPTPAITRLPSRVYVPGNLVEGLSTEWNNTGRGLQLQASAGQPGRLEGSPTSGFRALAGRASGLGLQFDSAPWQMAARYGRAEHMSLLDTPVLLADYFDAESTQLSVRRERDGQSLQANLVTTRTSALAGQRSGFWLDNEWKSGPSLHTWGLYWLDTDLSWAGQPLANNLSGVYGRTAWHSRQWSAEGGLDWLRSVSNPSNTGVFATGSVRWRYSRDLTFGAGASARRFNGDAWSAYADSRWQNGAGSSGLRIDVSDQLNQTRSQSLTLDHDWRMPTSWSLSTSLTAGHETRAGQSDSRWAAAASLGAPLSANTVLRGNLNTERSSAGDARSGANLSLNWRINTHWTLENSYNYARGIGRTIASIDPLAPPVVLPLTPVSSRSFLVVLRFEDRAGSRSAPLGGRSLDGGGRIDGTVFLDANRNGHQEASEGGAAGVTVYLDNRYTVRTDSQGRYEFPFVAAGPHVVTVLNETLPLPWIATNDGRSPVEVRVREDQHLNIGVVRQGGD
jgi:hypothetical protein